MNEKQMVRAIKQELAGFDSMRAAARYLGVNVSYLHDCLNGRRKPGPAILKPLGYRRRVEETYEKVK